MSAKSQSIYDESAYQDERHDQEEEEGDLIQISDLHNPPRYSQAISEESESLIDQQESGENLLNFDDGTRKGVSSPPLDYSFQVTHKEHHDGANCSARLRSLIPPDLKLVRTAEVTVIMPKSGSRDQINKSSSSSPTKRNQISPVTSLSPSPVNAGYLNDECIGGDGGSSGSAGPPVPAPRRGGRGSVSPSFRLEPIEEGRPKPL